MKPTNNSLIRIDRRLAAAVDALAFAPPVAHVYNPLVYARDLHEQYLARFGTGHKRVVFLGMNPGPFGMAQCGVPFGEVDLVRTWMGLEGRVEQPADVHPKRPIQGLDCPRSEVSGKRLWGLFAERFPRPEDFFSEHFVLNFCPLAFLADTGRNITPDKLPASEREALYAPCEQALRETIALLEPAWIVGVGAFARQRAEQLALGPRVGQILHPSPASPLANRGWAPAATRQLQELGIW